MNDAPSATTKVKRIVSPLSAEPEAYASPAISALISTRPTLNATRGSRDHGSTKEMPANSAARPASSRICVVSEPGISSGPIVAIAPASAIAPHTAAAMRPMFSVCTGALTPSCDFIGRTGGSPKPGGRRATLVAAVPARRRCDSGRGLRGR